MELTDTPPPIPDPSERALAALAYLGALLGLWLLAPVAIYLLRRKHSRFVAHHAARALILQLLFVPLGAVLTLLGVVLGTVLLTVLDTSPGANLIVHATLIALTLTSLAPLLLLLIVTLAAALCAYRGLLRRDTRLGRASEWLLRQDPGLIAHAT